MDEIPEVGVSGRDEGAIGDRRGDGGREEDKALLLEEDVEADFFKGVRNEWRKEGTDTAGAAGVAFPGLCERERNGKFMNIIIGRDKECVRPRCRFIR